MWLLVSVSQNEILYDFTRNMRREALIGIIPIVLEKC